MTPETTIQQNICSAFSLLAGRPSSPFVFFAVPNEGFLKAAGTGNLRQSLICALLTNLKKIGLLPGVSDLIVLHAGRAYCLEVKTETGRQSDSQRLFEAACIRCGVPYAIVRSVDDAIKKLKEWEVIR